MSKNISKLFEKAIKFNENVFNYCKYFLISLIIKIDFKNKLTNI